MINFCKNITTTFLILAVFICIIQLILPQGKLKQNVVFVAIVVVMMLIIEPFIKLINDDIDFDEIFNQKKEEFEIANKKAYFEKYYDDLLIQTFEENVRNDIIVRLKNAGYKVNSVECVLNKDTMEPDTLKLEIESNDGFVQPVIVDVMKRNEKELSAMDEYKIVQILMENYGVNKDNIFINVR